MDVNFEVKKVLSQLKWLVFRFSA